HLIGTPGFKSLNVSLLPSVFSREYASAIPGAHRGAHSPFLFNFVIDEIMIRTLQGLQNPGVQIACEENLVDLEYADDIVLIFEEKAQVFLGELNKVIPSFVVGNEILTGKVEETNARLVCRAASTLGLKLQKISILPDVVEVVAREANDFMRSFDVVITSGGIGPTHDDVTFEGLAKALGKELITHPELVHVVENFFGFDAAVTPTDPRIRLARVPLGSELVYGIDFSTGRQSSYPVVKVNNVYVLPGVPRLFRTAFEIIKTILCFAARCIPLFILLTQEHLRDPRIQFSSRSIYTMHEESKIAPFLSVLAEKYGSHVAVGSYPAFHNSYYRVRVVLDSQDEEMLEVAFQEAKDYFGPDIVSYEPNPVAIADSAVCALANEPNSVLGLRVSKAIETIQSALEQFDSSQLVIGFNGGKDCTVLLHLIYSVYLQRQNRSTGQDSDASLLDFPKLLYIRSRSVFPELENFVQRTVHFYHLPSSSILRPTDQSMQTDDRENQIKHGSLIIYEGDIKSSLERLLRDFPNVRGVFMGTRLSDPRSAHLRPMVMTDPGWPQLMRINPILDWTYEEVWRFIRRLSLPYCSLYDVGYTSLGSMEDTHPNPRLRYVSESGRSGYHPAYTLSDPESERSGRRRPSSTSSTPVETS
ncbi:hypothetical protein T265_15126, partial [Opisthorchis viverrini]